MVAPNLINRQLKIIWAEYKVNDIIDYKKALKQFQKNYSNINRAREKY